MRTSKSFSAFLYIFLNSTFLIGQCFEFPQESGYFITARGEPCVNTIVTAVPFLRITPDARSAGMGDAGIATSADANALHFNASKLAFSDRKAGLSLTYTPWLKGTDFDDVYLGYLSSFFKIGKKKTNVIGGSLRHFSSIEVMITDENGVLIDSVGAKEWEINTAYASKIAENLSISISGKYIYSNLASGLQIGSDTLTSGTSIAMDLSMSYRKKIGDVGTNDFIFIGATLSNLGTKIIYTNPDVEDFIPANFGLGIAWNKSFNQKHLLTLTVDANKLLVQTPDPSQADLNGNGIPDYQEASVTRAIFTSFVDAPGGQGEELREISFSCGTEYWYNQTIALRLGYYYESATKGNLQYLTLGMGGRYHSLGLNISYLIPRNDQSELLGNTTRVSLLYDFGD